MNANLYRYVLSLMFVLSVVNLMAQTGINISGNVIDSTQQIVIGARICLIQGKDSICTISDEKGTFQFNNVNRNNFTIKAYALGYFPWSKEYILLNNSKADIIAEINLKQKINILKEIVVRASPSIIVLKKDTIEYNVNDFKLRENSVLNDLLKRLPGLTISENGEITYLGNSITKIKINGQEISIDNIKSLVNILSTEVLDKIQLIDDYGDLAQITGRKFGTPNPILNIKTKDELKLINQINSNLSIGNHNRRELSGIESRISPDQQIYVTVNNNNTSINDPGDKTFSLVHLGYIKTFDALTIRSNESIKNYTVKNTTTQYDQTTTTAGKQFSYNKVESNDSNNSKTFYIAIDYKYKKKVLTSVFHGELNKNNSSSAIISEQNGLQHLSQSISNISKQNTPFLDHTLFFSSPLNNKGRIFTINEYIYYAIFDKTIKNYTSTRFYYTDNAYKDSIINQIIKSNSNSITISGQSSLIEPIDQKSNIEISYNTIYSKNSNILKTYLNDDTVQKQVLIDSLSSNYKYATWKNELTINYKLSYSNINLLIGGNFTFYKLSTYGKNLENSQIKGSILSPIISIEYKNRKSQLKFSNATSVIFPSYQQVQPVTNRIAIQNPVFGNPQLKPQVNYIFIGSYRHIGKIMYQFNIIPQISLNKISTNVVLTKDSNNNIIQETHYINTYGNFRFGFNGGIFKQFKGGKYLLSYEFRYSFDNNILYLDDHPFKTQTTIISQNIKGKIFVSWIDLSGVLNYEYNKNEYLLYNNTVTSYKSLNFQISTKIFFLKTWSISNDINKQLNFGLSNNIATNPILINAGVEKSFLKNLISAKFQAINILDERALASQTLSGNTISETKSNNIGKYFLMSIILNFKKIRTK